MTEAEWVTSPNPAALLSAVPTEPSDRRLRLLVCAACRRLWDVLNDGGGRDAWPPPSGTPTG